MVFCPLEYYSALKKEGRLDICYNLVGSCGIMLSEISQTEKDKNCMISLICKHVLRKAKLIGRENRLLVARGWDQGWVK